MKIALRALLFILLSTSCAQIYFVEPQPLKGMVIKSFIDEVQGAYSDSVLDVEILKNEVIIAGDRYHLTTKNPLKGEVLVKYYKDFYFFSLKDSSYYSVYMAKFYDNKLAVYMLNADDFSVGKLNKITNVAIIDSTNKTYLLQPNKKQFDDLVDYEMFDVVNVMKKN